MRTTYDVIVVGGGGSGLAAAASAAEAGASVLVLEKEPTLGGTTGIAVGSFTACQTSFQRAQSIQDDTAAHDEDAGKFAGALEPRNNGNLRRHFLSHTSETLEWLRGMGLVFHGPVPEPPNRVPRMHNVVPGARAYIAALQARLLRSGGTVLCGAVVTELMRDGSRVAGVTVQVNGEGQTFSATRGVVLAAGDYANSPTMISKYKGARFDAIEGINPAMTGDGHRLAESAGARLINMDVVTGPQIRFVAPSRPSLLDRLRGSGPLSRVAAKCMPLVPRPLLHAIIKRILVVWQRPENALFDDGAILLNARGERFCNEKVSPDREIEMSRQPNKASFILLDQRLVERYSAWPHFVSTAPEIAYAYVNDYLRLRPDVSHGGSTLADVARAAGMRVESVEEAVAQYNRYTSGTAPDPWDRTGDRELLRGDRWVILGPAKAYFATTEGGAAINLDFEVLDEHGQPIPGLYAVGQNGLGGQILLGHGLHIAWAITSGRMVGRLLGGRVEPAT